MKYIHIIEYPDEGWFLTFGRNAPWRNTHFKVPGWFAKLFLRLANRPMNILVTLFPHTAKYLKEHPEKMDAFRSGLILGKLLGAMGFLIGMEVGLIVAYFIMR